MAPVVLYLIEHTSGMMKEGIATWDGLWKLVPPTEMGREVIANCSFVGQYGRPTRCVKKDWYDLSILEVNEEFR